MRHHHRPDQHRDPAGRPRRQDGAPLRRRLPRRARRCHQSSPSSGRGSIAAPPAATGTSMSSVVPVVRTGLHCGEGSDGNGYYGTGSSPSSGRGSIAALRRRTARISSRGRPRRQDGAPLRRRTLSLQVANTDRRPRRQDGAPLRRRRRRRRPRHRRQVVPVVRTGLHCGGGITGRPHGNHFVVPVVRTGLHCGDEGHLVPLLPVLVVPVVRTGLHCGRLGPPLTSHHPQRRPRRQDGAPLRRLVGDRRSVIRGASSPSSGRGSIAALTREL